MADRVTGYQPSEFARELLGSMMDAHRAGRGPVSGSGDSPMLPDWRDGLHPELREAVERHAIDNGIKLHDHIAAMNSSMAFAFNLFAPALCRDPKPLADALSHVCGESLAIEHLWFEYVGDCDVLAETAGSEPGEDEKFTAADVGIAVRRGNGDSGIILIEVKLTESDFTTCGGRDSRGNRRRDVCESSAMFFDDPASCYLRRPYRATRDRRYWTIFAREFGSVRKAFPRAPEAGCPFAGSWQQPMRNHALAMGLVQAGRFQFWRFGLVHHDRNPDVVPPWESYCDAVADPCPLFRLPAGELVDQLARTDPWWVDWADYMRDRYFLKR